MAPRGANHNVIHVNVSQIFHCTALGDNNYTAFYASGKPWSGTVHNLHSLTWWPLLYLSLKFVASKMDPALEQRKRGFCSKCY